jgi:hypothetical protein
MIRKTSRRIARFHFKGNKAMKYHELYEEYQKLLGENRRLKAENEEYRNRLGLAMPVSLFDCENTATTDEQILNNSSPPEDKIKLFMSLFRGRDDVYAKRWENKKGESGYSPVCRHEWVRGLCNKRRIRCSECDNRDYAGLSPFMIGRHLRGKTVLGVYPMLEDETCYFLAIDFDGAGWEKDISVVREICFDKNIPVAVERSRSGNGAHVWFFFEDRVSAVLARRFGTALVTQAMGKRHELKFRSYDRLFPNQDTLPKGGLGNLIALPLQLKSRENGNSVFIGENLRPYRDQWSFLGNVRKLSESELVLC